jgi:hypothetical protein
MFSWSDSILDRVYSFANILGILGTFLVVVSLSLIYFTGAEMAKRSTKKWHNSEEDAHNKTKRLEKTELELAKTKKQLELTGKIIAPPTISLINKTIEKVGHGMVAKLTFQSSKPEGLPPLAFKAKVTKGNAKITLFDLDINDESIPQSNIGQEIPVISHDGKYATTNFYTINSPRASIRVDVTGPAKVEISGKYLNTPVVITIP